MTIDEQLIASLAQPIGQPTSDQTTDTGMVPDAAAPIVQGSEPLADPGMGTPQGEEQKTPTADPIVPDYNKYVEEVTGGLFKNVDAFKEALPKLSEYETLKKERDEFKAKTEVNPYASDYVKILNELVAKGATPDQLNNFQKINSIGDINALSPIDAKVAKLVLIDGYKESTARKMVDRDYPLSDYEDGSDEKEIAEEKLRIDSNQDRAALAQYKAETSTIKNPQEDQQLQVLAQRQQHENYVKAEVPKIAAMINGMGKISLDIKDKTPIDMQFDYPADYKAQIAPKLQEYFMDGQTPINNETVQQAFKTINAAYLDENFPQLANRIANTAYAKAWEDATNKYENRSGLPQSPEIQVTPNSNSAYNDFLNKTVLGKQ